MLEERQADGGPAQFQAEFQMKPPTDMQPNERSAFMLANGTFTVAIQDPDVDEFFKAGSEYTVQFTKV